MSWTSLEIRRALLRMTTLDTLVIGRLTVRLFKTSATCRLQITSAETRQVYSYPRYVDYDWLEGGYNALSAANDALSKAAAYIVSNHENEALSDRRCPECGKLVLSTRSIYCGGNCRERAYKKRRSASLTAGKKSA